MQITFNDVKDVLVFYKNNSSEILNTFKNNFTPQDVIDFLNSNYKDDEYNFEDYILYLKRLGFKQETNFVFAFMMGVASQRMLTEK